MRFSVIPCLLASILCALCAGAFAVTLNEVMYDPDGSETCDEFLELYNESQFAVSLSGYRISIAGDIDSLIALNQGIIAAPHQYVLVMDPDYFEDGSRTYEGRVPENALIVTIHNSAFGSRGLVNTRSDTITLLDAQGNVRSRYGYHIGNTEGYSDEKILPQAGDSALNWMNGRSLYGTPGARNSVTPPDHDLAVTGLVADPQTPQVGDSFTVRITVKNAGRNSQSDSLYLCRLDIQDSLTEIRGWSTGTLSAGDSAVFAQPLCMETNAPVPLVARLSGHDEIAGNDRRSLIVSASGTARALVINEIQFEPEPQRSEWVELANPGPLDWNMAGWRFADGTGIADTSRRVALPDAEIASGSFAVLAADSSIFFENLPAGIPVILWGSNVITLNNNGDSLSLFSPDGQMIDRVDYRLSWSSGTAGNSIERVSAGAASNDPLNWASCLDSAGSTPGRANSRALAPNRSSEELLTMQPNPFSPDGDGHDDVLSIHYRLEQPDSRLDLKIYDVRGRLIRRLANNEAVGYSGEKLWDGKDDHGRTMPTGLYIVYLEALGKGGTRIQSTRRAVALARPS